MAAFDLGLANGDNWGAAQVDAVELGISTRGVESCTTAQRLAISGAQLTNGKVVFDTTLREHLYYDSTDTTWHGIRSHTFSAFGAGNATVADNTVHTALSATLPDYGVPGTWRVAGHLGVVLNNVGSSTGTAVYISLWLGGVEVDSWRTQNLENVGYPLNGATTGSATQAAGSTTAVSLTWQQQSPGNWGYYTLADYRFNRVDATFVPS